MSSYSTFLATKWTCDGGSYVRCSVIPHDVGYDPNRPDLSLGFLTDSMLQVPGITTRSYNDVLAELCSTAGAWWIAPIGLDVTGELVAAVRWCNDEGTTHYYVLDMPPMVERLPWLWYLSTGWRFIGSESDAYVAAWLAMSAEVDAMDESTEYRSVSVSSSMSSGSHVEADATDVCSDL